MAAESQKQTKRVKKQTRCLRGTPVAQGVNFETYQRSPGCCILHVSRWSGLVASGFDQLATR